MATAAGGSAEIVIDGQTGLLVPVDDRTALAAAIRRLVTDGTLRDRLGAAAHEHVSTTLRDGSVRRRSSATCTSLMAVAKRIRR